MNNVIENISKLTAPQCLVLATIIFSTTYLLATGKANIELKDGNTNVMISSNN